MKATFVLHVPAVTLRAVRVPSPAGIAGRCLRALHAWLAARRFDERERYLGASIDHADFGRRLRAWEQYERSRIHIPHSY